jgi:hypothetical protein
MKIPRGPFLRKTPSLTDRVEGWDGGAATALQTARPKVGQ